MGVMMTLTPYLQAALSRPRCFAQSCRTLCARTRLFWVCTHGVN